MAERLESNARNGSMTAMQLSQSELLYNPEYARQCDAFADKVERNGAESNPDALYLYPVNRNLLSGRFLLYFQADKRCPGASLNCQVQYLQ